MVYRGIHWEDNIEKVFFWHRYGYAIGSIISDIFKQPDNFDQYNGDKSLERETLFEDQERESLFDD